ncbi:hypothetical protein [Psychrobacillus psychrodurans]|uniref:hypothetical protein n=1 Tax=Psychrobacillus psychrodurans TaxID=126157 RepID=UPI003D031B90
MQRKKFENVLYSNENRNIGLFLTKNQFVEGILLDIQNNHIVLEVERSIVYIEIHQIQALSKSTKDLRIAKESSPHLVRNDLIDVLIALRYHWVTINKFSNPTLVGVLSSIFEDYIILINNKELLYIPISHVTDISCNISKSDYYFLNKREQLNIQKLYRMGTSKESTQLKELECRNLDQAAADANILVTEEKLATIHCGIQMEVMEPKNTYAIEENAISSQLEESLKSKSLNLEAAAPNILVKEEKLSTIDAGVHTEVTKSMNTDMFEENAFSPQMEETLESITLDLVEASANIFVNDVEVASLDNPKEVTEHINTYPMEGNASSQLEETLESIGFDLGVAEVNVLVSDQEAATIDIPQEVTESINTDTLEENSISPQLEDLIIEEQKNVFSDEQLNLPQNPLKLKRKDVLLTAWSTMNNDQSTVALPKKTYSKKKLETPIENTMIINRDTGLNKQPSLSNQINNTDRQDKLNVLDKESETSEKKKTVLNVNVLSKEEVNEMLEQQYFALMNYVAVQISNGINSKQEDNKFYFHPRAEDRVYGPEKIRRSEVVSGYPFYDSKSDTTALEKQYISLLSHATKMYRKLRN